MQLTIARENKRDGYHYKIDQGGEWAARADYTFGLRLRQILIKNLSDGRSYTFRELRPYIMLLKIWFTAACLVGLYFGGDIAPWLLAVILLPIVGLFLLSPYYGYYESGACRGQSASMRKQKDGFAFLIDNRRYALETHSDFKASLTEDGEQVALLKRKNEVRMERNEYVVLYDKRMCDRLDVLLAMCLYVDAQFYPIRGFRFSFAKSESEKVLFDKRKDCGDWRPED